MIEHIFNGARTDSFYQLSYNCARVLVNAIILFFQEL